MKANLIARSEGEKQKRKRRKKSKRGKPGDKGPVDQAPRRQAETHKVAHLPLPLSLFPLLLLSSILNLLAPFILGSYKPCQQVRSLLFETVVTYNRQNFRDKS